MVVLDTCRLSRYEMWGLVYAFLVIAVAFKYTVLQEISLHSSSQGLSPVVGRFNASEVISRRQVEVQTEFETALMTKGWNTLKGGGPKDEVTISRLETSDGSWPPYIKTTAYIKGEPGVVRDLFTWSNFETTQAAIDPLFEGVESLFEASANMRVIKKTTKRPLVYPKRIFTLGLVQGEQKREVRAFTDVTYRTHPIPRGTPTTTLVNVVPTAELHTQPDGYVTSYQDFVAWYRPRTNKFGEPVPGETELTIVMRVDMGKDIPHWLFLFIVGISGQSSMRSLALHLAKSINLAKGLR